MNETWHRKNRMPRNATLAQRVAWHMEHEKECGCRKMPDSLRKEIGRG